MSNGLEGFSQTDSVLSDFWSAVDRQVLSVYTVITSD